MLDFFISAAYGMGQPTQGQAGQKESLIGALFPFIIIIAVFYFIVFMPQKKQRKKREDMLNKIKTGDQVITASGMFGEVSKIVDENTVMVKIANNVTIKILKSGISQVVDKTRENKKKKK